MDGPARKIPTHETTYAALRDMILFGHLAPGQPVTIQGLIADLGAGMTPVREAIRQLAGAGRTEPETRVSESATSTRRRAAISTVCMRGSSRRGGGEVGGLEVTAQGY